MAVPESEFSLHAGRDSLMSADLSAFVLKCNLTCGKFQMEI